MASLGRGSCSEQEGPERYQCYTGYALGALAPTLANTSTKSDAHLRDDECLCRYRNQHRDYRQSQQTSAETYGELVEADADAESHRACDSTVDHREQTGAVVAVLLTAEHVDAERRHEPGGEV